MKNTGTVPNGTAAVLVDVMGVSDFTCRDRIRCVCYRVTYMSFQAGKHCGVGGRPRCGKRMTL